MRRHWIEVAWFAFALANVAVVFLVGEWETIPFHFVWVSLTLVYGLRMWRLRTTLIVMGIVTLVSGGSLLHVVLHYPNGPGLDEMAEVPLMAAMFVAMVFYTERTRAAIRAKQRMLDHERDFVRDASHELRTPITIARGHVELLRGSAGTSEAVRDADVALDEINRLGNIADRLLILASAEHPEFLHLRPLSIQPFLVHLVRRWETTTPRIWELRVSAEGSIPADQDRLELAIDSLIENAVKFTAPEDRIMISADRAGADLAIVVADTGEGIPTDQIPKIFDRFARADKDRTRSRGGTGLGLAIVKAITEAHGGHISVQSALGVGSAFRLELPGFQPAAPDETGSPEATSEPVGVPSGGR